MTLIGKNLLFITTIWYCSLIAASSEAAAPHGGQKTTKEKTPSGDMKLLDPKNGFVFERIINKKDVLLPVVNAAFQENFTDILTVTKNTIDPQHTVGHLVAFDIHCKTSDNRSVIIEIQLSTVKSSLARSVYFASKAYSSQLDGMKFKPNMYDVLKPVYSLEFTNFNLFPETEHFISKHALMNQKTGEIDIKEMKFTYVELNKLKKKGVKSHKQLVTDLEKFAYFLLNDLENCSYVQILGNLTKTNDWIMSASQARNQSTWTQSEIDQFVQHEDSRWILNDVVDCAGEVAKKEGKEEGRKEAMEEWNKRVINNCIKKKFSAKKIAKLFGLSETEVKAQIDQLNIPHPEQKCLKRPKN